MVFSKDSICSGENDSLLASKTRTEESAKTEMEVGKRMKQKDKLNRTLTIYSKTTLLQPGLFLSL
jgi:hypothetical protein